MKTIGMIGGMSWESTLTYYQEINQGVNRALGGLHSAKIVLVSVDFSEVEHYQASGEWKKAAQLLIQAAQAVEKAGADFFIICTNTMHKVANEVQSQVNIPLLHIADATGQKLKIRDVKKVGLLGTAFTMEEAFYKEYLEREYGVEVIVPNGVQRRLVHDVIYQELCQGKLISRSKSDFLTIIGDLYEAGAEAVILGCTEIGLLVKPEDTRVKLLDTTQIHVESAVHRALK
ncbi:aspartate/glutamate racemase family protein [Vibrio sp. ZSDE26]|uniref:Aspartate/glutamate racemase family protein n=1 Tax=Vibrio amylolyticus TaxID=2847292 RepID=A0A9X1XI47_9VIBR|nr:aspartate/glutamate racemase family protein [Vibrio amylolyticus]MCK6263447.1 aspartate/glutamate racemase family protein [Vibrio amylolyticus]